MDESKQVNPILAIAACVLVLGVIGFFGYRALQPRAPDPNSYTPGVPPWLDPKSPQYGKAAQAPPARGAAPGAVATGAPGR